MPKQTERCHPLETRPLSVREYARIQTFPDNWVFQGSMSDKYKQIGNAVPVNLAWAVGRSLIRLFNDIQRIMPENTQNCTEAVREIMHKQSLLEVVKITIRRLQQLRISITSSTSLIFSTSMHSIVLLTIVWCTVILIWRNMVESRSRQLWWKKPRMYSFRW